jgi:hypothetical protein
VDDIFDNIFVYLPIILIVLFRILGARRAAGKNPPVAEPEPRQEPPETVGRPRQKPPEKPVRPRKEPSRTIPPISQRTSFPEAPRAAASPAKPAPGTGRAAGSGFPGNLNYLSALKQAMVLAEIMGPPKALQERPDQGFEPPGGIA